MRISKGKVVFGHKDTWDMETQLAKVIVAGVTKFKEVINSKDGTKGVPASISNKMESEGNVSRDINFCMSDEDFKKCEDYFDHVLSEIIYAFTEDNEPSIMDYDFSYESISGTPLDNGLVPLDLKCTNEAESERYGNDMKAYRERCDKGRELFAKYFNTLWW